MVNVIALGGVLLALLTPATAAAAPATEEIAAPNGVTVSLVAVNGSGCPAAEGASGSAVLSADGSTVTVTSPAYYAWAGGEAYPLEFRRNCQFALRVNRPAGYTFAVSQVHSAGFAYLAKGANGVSVVSLYFQGGQTVSVSRTFPGPMANTWETTSVPGLVYAPCDQDRLLNVNTELRVAVGNADRSITNFMVREPTTTLRLVWRRCA